MTSNRNEPRQFRIEGSGVMLNAPAEAIEQALRAARLRPDRTGTGSVTHGLVTIEVAASDYDEADGLSYAISSIEDAVRTISGWAKPNYAKTATSQLPCSSTTLTSKVWMAMV